MALHIRKRDDGVDSSYPNASGASPLVARAAYHWSKCSSFRRFALEKAISLSGQRSSDRSAEARQSSG